MNKELNVKVDVSGVKEAIINYIIPLVAVALTLLIGFFVLVPSYKSIPALESELEQNTALKNNLTTKLDSLNRIIDFKTIVDENSNLVDRVLVSEQLVPGLLTQVDRIAKESGLLVSRLNYGLGSTSVSADQNTAPSYEYVTVNLGVKGSYEQLKTFLINIENAARIINVDSVRYSLNEDQDGTSLGVTFVLVSPYLYVESNAVTDELVNLDITDPKFIDLVNKIKNMKYYDPNEINIEVPVVEAPVDEVPEDQPAEVPAEQPAELPVDQPVDQPAEPAVEQPEETPAQ